MSRTRTEARFHSRRTRRANGFLEMARELGYSGGMDHFRHIAANIRPPFDAFDWMLSVLQKTLSYSVMKAQLSDFRDLDDFLNHLYAGRLSQRNKSLAILACQRGLTIHTICHFLGMSSNTLSHYKRIFANGGSQALFSRKPKQLNSNDETLKGAIYST